jgi:hypothetical protein
MGNTSIKKNKYKFLKKKDNKINNNKINNKINVSYDLINFSETDDDDNYNSYSKLREYDKTITHHQVSFLLGDNNNNNVNFTQKINIFNLQFMSLWLNVYYNNISKYNISNILIYDFNTYFLQNKNIPCPSDKTLTIVANQNINNFLYTLILYYNHQSQYNLKTRINEQSNIQNVIVFIQELIMIFLDKYDISIGMIGPVNPSKIYIANNQLYKKFGIYDVYNDGIFSSKNGLIFNTNIKTIFNTSMILINHFKLLNVGVIHKPTNTQPEIISISLSLFYRFINTYSVIQ